MGSGGEVFSFTPSGGFVPSSQVTVDAQTEILSLTQLRISGTSRVLSLVLSFGRCREKGVDCWLWCWGGGGRASQNLPRAAAFPAHLFPTGTLQRLPVKAGVTTVYQCPQTKCQIPFLAHDLAKQRQAASILLFLTTTANLTPISLHCHENLP